MKSFEVQIQRSGEWQTDSTYDDRELAEQRASQIESGRRVAPVRIVEEVFVEKTQKYVWRTIYRDSNFQQAAQSKASESRQSRGETTVAERPSVKKETENRKGPEVSKKSGNASGQQRTPPMNNRKSLSAGALFGILILIVGMGIGAMIALEYFLKLS